MKPINLFLGYDSRQPVAFQVAAHSVWQHASTPVSITRLELAKLPITRRGLTEFTYSRFLAPYLCGFEGTSIFMDSDVLVRGDVAELLLFPLAWPKTPVFVYKGPRKFEWASVMVFNNKLCQCLTPTYIENPKLNPLSFPWAAEVGELPHEWNHLVGYDAHNPSAKLAHLTQGIPVWPETKDCDYADEWRKVFQQSCSTVSFEALMGKSVHVQHMQKVG